MVDGDVVQLLVQNCTRLWLPVFKKSLDSQCFKQLSVMSHFSSAQQLEIVRVVETSSDAAGESVSQDLRFCDVWCSMELAVPQWSWTHHARCRPADGEGSQHGMVDALGSHEQGIISRCDAAMMMMLAREIDDLASDVVVYGVVSRSVASLGQPTAECLGCVVPAEGWVHGEVGALDSHVQDPISPRDSRQDAYPAGVRTAVA